VTSTTAVTDDVRSFVRDFVCFAIEQNMRRDPQWALTYLKAFWDYIPEKRRRRYLRKLVKNRCDGVPMFILELLSVFLES